VNNPLPLPAGVAGAFARLGSDRRLRRGGVVFRAGSAVPGLHLVVSGHLRILRGTPRAVVVHHEGPGGLLGETALFGATGYPGTAVATEPTALRLLPAASVWQLLREDPEASAFFLRRLAERLRGVITRLDDINSTSVSTRLLTHLRTRPGADEGRAVSLGMTQNELAEELGTVREVIVRELRRLVKTGIIAAKGRGMYQIVS
jgi:CRP/FNR family transcriptional regulator